VTPTRLRACFATNIFPNELALYGANGLAMTVDDTLAILPDALKTPGCEPHH
jgi:hypothetical protein